MRLPWRKRVVPEEPEAEAESSGEILTQHELVWRRARSLLPLVHSKGGLMYVSRNILTTDATFIDFLHQTMQYGYVLDPV